MRSYLDYKNLLADAMLLRHVNIIMTCLVQKCHKIPLWQWQKVRLKRVNTPVCHSTQPYRFEPTKVSNNSDREESKSNLDENQASFTDIFGHTSWFSCAKCSSMPRAVECFCCDEIEIVNERLEGSELSCITEAERSGGLFE